MAVVLRRDVGGALQRLHFVEPLLVAEAVVSIALLDELAGVFGIDFSALRLDIGADRAADVGAFVPVEAGFPQGLVDDVHRAFDEAFLIGVLDAQDEGAVLPARLGGEIGVKGGAQIAHVHVAGGARRKSGAGMAVINH